jgi:DUF971 family protein
VAGAPVPLAIHRDDREIVITWAADHRGAYPSRFLRQQCPCAQCRDEITGRRLLDPESVPPEVAARKLQLVGNYAMRVEWSDGHGTGIFTWELLFRLCPCERCGGAGAAR